MNTAKDAVQAASNSSVALVKQVEALEVMRAPVAMFHVECLEAKPGHEQALRDTQALIAKLRKPSLVRGLLGLPRKSLAKANELHARMCKELMQTKWVEDKPNTVCTGGKNDLLDKYFAGSSYTAAWFCGLISSVSYSAISAADTMASHAGWLEAGGTNAPTFTGARPALAFSSASSGSKSTSSASSFTFTGTGTIKGMFGTSITTKDGTTGILYNAVLFTGGDRAVVNTDVVNVSVTYSA